MLTRTEPTAAPDVTVIVVTWNVRELALACLRAVGERADGLAVELIVVDNASTDGTVPALRDAFPEATLIVNRGNVGFPAANNQALAHARGRHVLFLNPDTVVGRGTLAACVRELDADPTVGVVGCRMVYPDGRIQYEGGRRDYRLRHLFWEALYLHELFPRSALFAHQLMGDWDHQSRRDVEALLGAFMLARAEVARAIGGLPDEVFMFHEDLAFCLRARARGWRVRYLGDVETVHHGGASRGQSSSALDLLQGEVRVRLIRERGGPVRAALARPAFALRSLARLTLALAFRWLPGLGRLRAERPKAFEPRIHALLLLWAISPAAAAPLLPRAEPTDRALVLAPGSGRPAGAGGAP